MASGIIRRTALMDDSKGYVIFHDYCIVNTSIGNCVEFDAPFQQGMTGRTQFDPSAESYKVDEIISLSLGVRHPLMKDENTGLLLQEIGVYKTGY